MMMLLLHVNEIDVADTHREDNYWMILLRESARSNYWHVETIDVREHFQQFHCENE